LDAPKRPKVNRNEGKSCSTKRTNKQSLTSACSEPEGKKTKKEFKKYPLQKKKGTSAVERVLGLCPSFKKSRGEGL